jgi:preprotein translocase subunit YajC
MSILIPLVLLLVFFWFFVMLPQRRRQRQHATMQETLALGEEVITAGGLHGEVVGLEESVVRLEIAPGMTVRVDRRAVAGRVETVEIEDASLAEPVVEEEQEPAESGTANDANPG